MSEDEKRIPCIKIDYGLINPNHKARLFAFLPPENRWIANLSFVKSDNSVYISPQVESEITVVGIDRKNTLFQASSPPETDIHVSLHESGVVNLTLGEQSYRLRGTSSRASNELITFGIKDPAGLRIAHDDEVNSLPERYQVIPVMGFLHVSPVFVSLYQVKNDVDWSMPELSHTFQTHVGFGLSGMNIRYEIVVWQNPNIPEFPGDIAFSIGHRE